MGFSKAVEPGYAHAQYALGVMYLNGKGVSQNDKQAVYWISNAAEQGVEDAQYALGVMYFNGKGVTQDDEKSYICFYLSRYNGNQKTENFLNILSELMTSSDVSEAQEASKVCLESNYKKCD